MKRVLTKPVETETLKDVIENFYNKKAPEWVKKVCIYLNSKSISK